MLWLSFLRGDNESDATYYLTKRYQGFSSWPSVGNYFYWWGIISTGGEPQFPLEKAKHYRFPSYQFFVSVS